MSGSEKYNLDELIKVRDGLDRMLTFRSLIPAAIERSTKIQEQLSKPGFTWANNYLSPPQDILKRNLSFTAIPNFVDQVSSMPEQAQRAELLARLPASNNLELPQVDMSKGPEILAWMQMTMKSLDALFVYGQSIQSLIRAAIDGNDEAFFKAVSIDRAVLELPEFSARMRLAESAYQSEFLEGVQKAMKGPSGHIKLEHPLLRYFLSVMNESGMLGNLGFQERYQLFCVELGVYPSDGDDPAGSLDKFIDRWEKSLST